MYWTPIYSYTAAILLGTLCLLASSKPAEGFFHKKKERASVDPRHFESLKMERPKKVILAPNFALDDFSGRQISLRELRGKVVFLNFWATWCPPCVQEMPTMEKLHQTFGKKGLTILAINYRETTQEVKDFFSKHKLTFIALLDRDGKVSERYQAWGLPITVIVNKRGEIVGKVMGSRDWYSKEAREFFEQLLEEKP